MIEITNECIHQRKKVCSIYQPHTESIRKGIQNVCPNNVKIENKYRNTHRKFEHPSIIEYSRMKAFKVQNICPKNVKIQNRYSNTQRANLKTPNIIKIYPCNFACHLRAQHQPLAGKMLLLKRGVGYMSFLFLFSY